MSLLNRAQSMLGVTQIARTLAAIAICSALSGAAGFWAGMRWQQGATAIAEGVELRREVSGLQSDVVAMHGEAVRLRNAGLVIADEFRRAHARQSLLILQHEARVDALDQIYRGLGASVDAWVESNRAALAGCRLGADGVQLWSAAARGAAAGGPAAEPTAGPASDAAGALPAGAAGLAQRPADRRAADVAAGGEPVPPLPRKPPGPD